MLKNYTALHSISFKIYGDSYVKELHDLAFNTRLYCEFVSEPNGALERELKAINIGMIGKYR